MTYYLDHVNNFAATTFLLDCIKRTAINTKVLCSVDDQTYLNRIEENNKIETFNPNKTRNYNEFI